MLSCNKRKRLLIVFFAFFLNAACLSCFGAYDVVKATTVKEVKQGLFQLEYDDEPEMYDGADIDRIENLNNEETFFEKKLKQIFKRKNKFIDENDSQEMPKEEIKEEQTPQKLNESYSSNDEVQIEEENIQVDDKNKFQINADRVVYDDKKGNIEAIGDVEIISVAQGVKLKADYAILDKTSQTLKLTNNVKIIKDGTEMRGESLIVDLNEQNILMDNPTLDAFSFRINAQEGYLIANDIQMLNGALKSTQQQDFPLISRGFMRLDSTYKNDFFEKNVYNSDNNEQSRRQAYKIESKEIVLTSYKNHNSVLLKGSNVYYNNRKIVKNSDIEIISDKKRQIVETNMPEIGNLRNFGTYIGYGMVYKMPKGHTLKLMPVLAYGDSNVGVGAIARYRALHGMVDGGWNTASTNAVIRGRYQFTNGLSLMYGRNAYLPEGFMGARRSGYAAQLQYLKSYRIKDLNANFSNGVYAGIFSEYEKHDQENAYATTRFRYMAQLTKNVLRYKNLEQGYTVSADIISQGAATLYGSGETHGVVRLGPQLTTRLKRWESSLGYFITGEHGQSPFLFDMYRYGKSTITLNEKFHFSDKFALGFRMFVTPMKDNYDEDLLTECRFYLIAGPKDMKVALSYDFVRDVAHMDFMFLIGSDNSSITFDKLSTKDIDGKAQKRDFYKHAKPVKINPTEEI